jgi:transposase
MGSAHGRSFAERVKTIVADQPAGAGMVPPILQARCELLAQAMSFDKAVRHEVRRRAKRRLR